MSKNTVVRLLVGLVLLASMMLSACSALSRADAAPIEEPVLPEPPAGEDGDGLFIESVETFIMKSWPLQVMALVRGDLADGCTTIEDVRVVRQDESNLFEVTITIYRDPDAMCTMALVPFEESVSLDVEGLPAGTYTVDVHGVTATFELAADNDAIDLPVGEEGDGLFIDSVETVIAESWPVQIDAVIRGNLADGCTAIVDYRFEYQEDSGLIVITVGTYRDPDAMCTLALVPFEEVLDLRVEGMSAGTYTVDVHGVTTTFELAADNTP